MISGIYTQGMAKSNLVKKTSARNKLISMHGIKKDNILKGSKCLAPLH